MKASELIAALQALVAERGDLPVYATECPEEDYAVREAAFRPAKPGKVGVEFPARFLLS